MHGVKTQQLASPPWGQYTTASDYNNPKSTTSATGDAFADFLLGYPSTTDVTTGAHGGFLAKTDWSLFMQDDWKVTPRLTLNLGLRYDHFGFFYPTDGRAADADFTLGKIVVPTNSVGLIQTAFQPYSSLFITSAQAGLPDSLVHPDNLNFAPRFGFAYRLGPNFVIRGGFGIYNTNITYNEFGDMINSPPFTYRAQLSRSLLIANGVNVNTQYTFENPTANGSTAAAASLLSAFGGFTSVYPDQKAYEYNLTIEKQFGNYAVHASYVGNLGRNLAREVELNACVPGPVSCLSRTAGSPGARQWSQFGTAFGQHTEGGNSNFNSGEIEVSRRFANGLLFDVNYSFARLLAYQYVATNPVVSALWSYDYGPVSAQPNSVFHFNHVYDLPLGHGRQFGSNMNRVVNAVVGGWELSGVATWQSGQPLTVLAGVGQSPTGATSNRADRLCGGNLSNPTPALWFNTSCYAVPAYINPNAASPTRQFGTAGIGTVVGPRWFSYDANLQKRFTLHERATLSLRIDAFNIFNHPVLANPDVTVSDATFGQIRTASANYTPRTFQFGCRFAF